MKAASNGTKQGKAAIKGTAKARANGEVRRSWPKAAVAKAKGMKQQGASDRAISRELRAMKLASPGGGKWWSTTVAALLQDSGFKATKAAKPKAAKKEVAA